MCSTVTLCILLNFVFVKWKKEQFTGRVKMLHDHSRPEDLTTFSRVRVHAEGVRGAATDKEAPPRRTGARPLLPRHAAAVRSVGSVAGLQLHAACEPQLVSANRWS